MFGSKLTRANQKEGMGKGRVLVEKQVVEGRGRFLGAGVNDWLFPDGFLISLSKRHNTAFNTRRKFEIAMKNALCTQVYGPVSCGGCLQTGAGRRVFLKLQVKLYCFVVADVTWLFVLGFTLGLSTGRLRTSGGVTEVVTIAFRGSCHTPMRHVQEIRTSVFHVLHSFLLEDL